MLTTVILCALTFFAGFFFGGLVMQLDTAKKQNIALQTKNTELEEQCNSLAQQSDELHGLLQDQNSIIESYIGAKARHN